jgi:hypothetical protein
MQPWHDLIDRRQLAGRPGFAAWAAFANGAGFALRAWFAAWTRGSGLSRRPRLAARTFEAGPARMTLRPRTPRLAARALRPLPSLSCCVVGHGSSPFALSQLS